MPIRRPQLVNGEIYHIVIRAIEGLELFRDEKDYLRMIHDLFEFNDEYPTPWDYRQHYQYYENSSRSVKKKRKMLVEIFAFCLMPNHVHLLVRQIRGGGISKFMRKIGAGYGQYYNKKYERSGHVFQGRYRIVRIENEEQLKTLFVYIHANPVSLIITNWKEKGIDKKDLSRVLKFLENYRWSSYSDYLGNKNFPSLTNREFLLRVMSGVENSKEFVEAWLQFKTKLKETPALKITEIE